MMTIRRFLRSSAALSVWILAATPFAHADDLRTKCADLEKCIHAVAELTGEKYVYDSGILKETIASTKNFELTKENADEVFTLMLNQHGLTRMPLADANAIKAIQSMEELALRH